MYCVLGETYIPDDVKEELSRQYDGCVHRDFPIVDFIRRVWGFTPEEIPQGDYEIFRWLLRCYFGKGYYTKGVDETKTNIYIDGDRGAGKDFCDLMVYCLNDIADNNKLPMNKIKVPMQGQFRFNHNREELNPPPPNPTFHYDLGYSISCNEINWQHAGVIGELRKTRRMFDRSRQLEEHVKADLAKLKVETIEFFSCLV